MAIFAPRHREGTTLLRSRDGASASQCAAWHSCQASHGSICQPSFAAVSYASSRSALDLGCDKWSTVKRLGHAWRVAVEDPYPVVMSFQCFPDDGDNEWFLTKGEQELLARQVREARHAEALAGVCEVGPI